MQIIWFRRDLRLSDCEIVAEATNNQQEVLPCFIIDPWFYQPEVGAARVKFLFESLENLDANLRSRGSRLYLFEGSSVTIIKRLTLALLEQELRPKLYFNRDVQVEYGRERDRQILKFYRQLNLDVHIGINHFLQPDSDRLDNWWQDYHSYLSQPVHPTSSTINTPQLNLVLPQLTFAELKQKYRSFCKAGSHRFVGGEDTALNTLNSFLGSRYRGYHWRMSRPWLSQQGASSHLSPHLAFGTVSTRIVYQRTQTLLERLAHQPKAEFALQTFLDRLRWHDKFTQRLHVYPKLATQNRYPEFDEWYSPEELSGHKQELFEAWCEGQTGFPLVDASMRQLNSMGWMNFRMRAMCVSFLTINCGVSWHHGARYFMTRLVDGDIAINHWQWQMQSGVINPMSQSFRIYNPTKNMQEKDPELQFVRCWVPELRSYSKSALLSEAYSENSNYPKPIVDWKQTRRTNGKVVSNLRAAVRERLEREQGAEYQQAIKAKTTVDKYFEVKEKQYQNYQRKKRSP